MPESTATTPSYTTPWDTIHLTGQAPRQTDPTSAAAANVSAITQELLTRLENLQEAAA